MKLRITTHTTRAISGGTYYANFYAGSNMVASVEIVAPGFSSQSAKQRGWDKLTEMIEPYLCAGNEFTRVDDCDYKLRKLLVANGVIEKTGNVPKLIPHSLGE